MKTPNRTVITHPPSYYLNLQKVYGSNLRSSMGQPEMRDLNQKSVVMYNANIESETSYINKCMGSDEKQPSSHKNHTVKTPCIGSKYGF